MITLTFNENWSEDLSEEEKEKVWDLLTNALKFRTCEFTFVKKDGTEKKTKGTLRESFIPPAKEGTEPKAPNRSVVGYIDLEAHNTDPSKAWRSFSLSGIREFRVL